MTRTTFLLATALAAGSTLIAVPAVTAAPTVRARLVDGTLRVAGSPFADQIVLRASAADPNQLQIDVDADGSVDDGLTSTHSGPSSSTRVAATTSSSSTPATARSQPPGRPSSPVDDGDDILVGGSGNELFVGGRGRDFVDGNGGADTAFLGDGNDTFVWDPGDGNDTVDGGFGFDTHVFNGAGGNEIFAATAVGGRVRFTRNTGSIVMDLNDIEALDVNALGGTDSVTINDLAGTGLTDVTVDLASLIRGTAARRRRRYGPSRGHWRRGHDRRPPRTAVRSRSTAWRPRCGSRTPTRRSTGSRSTPSPVPTTCRSRQRSIR